MDTVMRGLRRGLVLEEREGWGSHRTHGKVVLGGVVRKGAWGADRRGRVSHMVGHMVRLGDNNVSPLQGHSKTDTKTLAKQVISDKVTPIQTRTHHKPGLCTLLV